MADEPAPRSGEAPTGLYDPVAWEERVAEARERRARALADRELAERELGATSTDAAAAMPAATATRPQRGPSQSRRLSAAPAAATPEPEQPAASAVPKPRLVRPVASGPSPAGAAALRPAVSPAVAVPHAAPFAVAPGAAPRAAAPSPPPAARRDRVSTRRLGLMFAAGLAAGAVVALGIGREIVERTGAATESATETAAATADTPPAPAGEPAAGQAAAVEPPEPPATPAEAGNATEVAVVDPQPDAPATIEPDGPGETGSGTETASAAETPEPVSAERVSLDSALYAARPEPAPVLPPEFSAAAGIAPDTPGLPTVSEAEATVPAIDLAAPGTTPNPAEPARFAAAPSTGDPAIAPAMTATADPPVALLPVPRPKALLPQIVGETGVETETEAAGIEPEAAPIETQEAGTEAAELDTAALDTAEADTAATGAETALALPDPIAAAAGHRINVHVPRGTSAETGAAVIDALRAAGFDAQGPIPVNLAVGTSNARYFFPSDAAAAAAAVSALDGRIPSEPVARNFTHLSARPTEGTLEFWLAGDDGGGSAPAVSGITRTAPPQTGLIRPAPFQAANPTPPPAISAGAVNSNRLRALVEAARGQ